MLTYIWLLSIVLICVLANNFGRSILTWSLVSVLLGPVSILVILVLGKDQNSLNQRDIDLKKKKICPNCKELVMFDAKICKHCRSHLNEVAENELVLDSNILEVKLASDEHIKSYNLQFFIMILVGCALLASFIFFASL